MVTCPEALLAWPVGMALRPWSDHPRVGLSMVLAVAEAASRVGWPRPGVTRVVIDHHVVRDPLAMDVPRVQTAGAALCPNTPGPLTCIAYHTGVPS